MKTIRLLVAMAGLFVVPYCTFAQTSSPYIVEGPTIVQSTCHGTNTLNSSCFSVTYPQGSPIPQNRYITVPRANVEFDFPVISSASSISTNFSVTVTAANVNPGVSVQGNASVNFTYPGTGSALLKIPLNLDWAESVITMQIVASQEQCQSISTGNPHIPPKPNCTKIGGESAGPALPSLSNLPQILPALSNLSPSAFVLLVTPAAAFQLDVLPVAIIYGPLGNVVATPSAQSFLAMSATVGTNVQIGSTGQVTYDGSTDDKTTYAYGLNFGQVKQAGLSMSVTGFWDDSTEGVYQSSDTTSTGVLTLSQEAETFTVLPSSTQPPLNAISCPTVPFLNDEILLVKDMQYAFWDYPGGLILQPLGNAGLLQLQVSTLNACTLTPNVPQSVCDSTPLNAPSYNPHCIPYSNPDQTKNDTLWEDLSSSDCASILSIDAFYNNSTPDVLPITYVDLLQPGSSLNTRNANTFSDTQAATVATAQTSATQITTKTTATAANGNDISAGLSLLTGLNITYDSGASGTQTTTYSSLLSNTSTNIMTVTDQIQASMAIRDSSALYIPARVVWDTTFEGIAAQDTNLNLTCTPAQMAATSPAPAAPSSILDELKNLPVVPRGSSAASLRQNGAEPPTYVLQKDNNSCLLVQNSKNLPKLLARQKAALADAGQRHRPRHVPPPAAPLVGILSPQDALQQLNRLKSQEKPILDATKHLQALIQVQ